MIATVYIIVVGKSIAALAIVLAFRYPMKTALTISVSLAQIVRGLRDRGTQLPVLIRFGDLLRGRIDELNEGFATAIHLSLDLESGEFSLRSAGHPPAAIREAGSGRWRVVETEGPVLGLIEGASYAPVSGRMRSGDAVLLYTDGMVETPNRDIGLGIDKLLGQAEQMLRGNFEGGAQRLIESLGARNDDRALLLLHRR